MRDNRNLKSHSKKLRQNTTEAEKHLWRYLRGKQLEGIQFYRQKILGNYIVDFYSRQARLVIELDGGQHYIDTFQSKDKLRDINIHTQGLRVLRFSNRYVLNNIHGVLENIRSHILTSTTSRG